jgi:hypothetical protein
MDEEIRVLIALGRNLTAWFWRIDDIRAKNENNDHYI